VNVVVRPSIYFLPSIPVQAQKPLEAPTAVPNNLFSLSASLALSVHCVAELGAWHSNDANFNECLAGRYSYVSGKSLGVCGAGLTNYRNTHTHTRVTSQLTCGSRSDTVLCHHLRSQQKQICHRASHAAGWVNYRIATINVVSRHGTDSTGSGCFWEHLGGSFDCVARSWKQSHCSPEGSSRLRLPDFKTIGTRRW
jgi:hypothetical protein